MAKLKKCPLRLIIQKGEGKKKKHLEANLGNFSNFGSIKEESG